MIGESRERVQEMRKRDKRTLQAKQHSDWERIALEKALYLADPEAADKREKEAAAAAATAASVAAALAYGGISAEAAAEIEAKKEEDRLEELRKKALLMMAVNDEISYDSDLDALEEAISNDIKQSKAAISKKQRAEEEMEELLDYARQVARENMEIKNANATNAGKDSTDNNNMTEGIGRVAAEIDELEEQQIAEEERRKRVQELDGDKMDELNEKRSEWLLDTLDVVMEVFSEKILIEGIAGAVYEMVEEDINNMHMKQKELDEAGENLNAAEKADYARLQINRLRRELIHLRRLYGKRIAYLS